MYSDPSGYFPILGLILGTIIGIASGSISVISQAVISPILNTLLAQGVTDVMTLGTTAGATYLGYLTGKLVVKDIKAIGKWFTNFWNDIKKGRISRPDEMPYYDPGVSQAPSRPNIPSFGGEMDHYVDDGDDLWNILDDPY